MLKPLLTPVRWGRRRLINHQTSSIIDTVGLCCLWNWIDRSRTARNHSNIQVKQSLCLICPNPVHEGKEFPLSQWPRWFPVMPGRCEELELMSEQKSRTERRWDSSMYLSAWNDGRLPVSWRSTNGLQLDRKYPHRVCVVQPPAARNFTPTFGQRMT